MPEALLESGFKKFDFSHRRVGKTDSRNPPTARHSNLPVPDNVLGRRFFPCYRHLQHHIWHLGNIICCGTCHTSRGTVRRSQSAVRGCPWGSGNNCPFECSPETVGEGTLKHTENEHPKRTVQYARDSFWRNTSGTDGLQNESLEQFPGHSMVQSYMNVTSARAAAWEKRHASENRIFSPAQLRGCRHMARCKRAHP